jgi:flagellin-like hook-associated protein FlgL
MSRINPIPTTRVGDFYVRQRLTAQVQQDQLDLFRLQTQVSTGRRLLVPSDDAPAALRAVSLQRLLDRKGQIRTNLEASNFYLAAAEGRLSEVSQRLREVRSEVMGVTDTIATQTQRDSAVQTIKEALELMLQTANAKAQGRYLFAGSRSQVQPYRLDGGFVEYLGNETTLRSYVDLERLFDTNLTGPEVFGGISSGIEGSADLDPQLDADTLVSTINGGAGIGANPAISISINTGTTTETSVVDLSEAVTIGDVARLIEAAAPSGTTITASITGDGLVLTTDAASITVAEVAHGRTARALGILSDPDAIPSDTINGEDLNPAVLRTTQLSDLLGTKARGVINPAGANNAIVLTAAQNGPQFNNLTVDFVNGASESASYDQGTNTLTIAIRDGVSTANEVVAAINAEGTFTADADYHEATSSIQSGTGTIAVTGVPLSGVTTGGGGETLDTASGFILTNGGEEVTLDISNAETVEDLLNLINGAGIGLLAEINADGDGINVRSRLSGADFTIGENGGTTAAQLGIRTYTGETELSALNRGAGVPTTSELESLDVTQLDDLRIIARDGTILNVNLAGATTLQDVADLINAATGNHDADTAVTASVSSNGNFLQLVDSSTTISDDLTVDPSVGDAAEYLGLVSPGAIEGTSSITNDDGDYIMSGTSVLGNDLMIEASDGTELWIDLAGAETIQDVVDRINDHPENQAMPKAITARLATTGNGIELVDGAGGTLRVHALEGSEAAYALGFVAEGQTAASSTTGTLQSEDRHTLEVDSVFNTLNRLMAAVESGDVEQISRELERLDDDMQRVNFARADMGARLQSLQIIDQSLEDENVQLTTALSEEIDIDLIEAISNMTARQYAFEASLRTAGSLLQLTLLNFI